MSMTREKAIVILMNSNEYHHAKGELPHSALSVEAFNMAIEALKEMSVEEYRQRLMEVFHRTDHDELLTYVVMPKEEEFKSLEDILRQYKYEPRQYGEWEKYGDKIEAYDIAGHKTWGQKRKCTKCGFIKTYIEDFGIYPFCPNCSALMWKEGDPNEKTERP